MSVYTEITKLLKMHKAIYTELEHAEVYTSAQAAAVRGVSKSIGAKALIFNADKEPVLFILPADKILNIKSIKKVLGIKNLALASKEEVFTLTGLQVGCIPPFGSLFKIKCYYDSAFTKKDKVAFNPALHTKSVIMNASDLIRIENPEFLDIT